LVLVAEDDPTLRSLIAMGLEKDGYELLEAADGEEAMRLGERHLDSVDLLLTDDRMPGVNGHELTRTLRSIRPDLKVIVMSGTAADEPAAPDLPTLLKPFTLQELSLLVASQLHGGTGRRLPPWPES
jgi:CheY-like chemotaxis protein